MTPDLIGINLPDPRRVVRVEIQENIGPRGICNGNSGIARNLRGTGKDHPYVRVKIDGTKGWETWHRHFWRLA